jgi:hypothetical protein
MFIIFLKKEKRLSCDKFVDIIVVFDKFVVCRIQPKVRSNDPAEFSEITGLHFILRAAIKK